MTRSGGDPAGFVEFNRSVCDRLAGYLPHTRNDIFDRYNQVVASAISERTGQLVVDVGTGKVTPYAPLLSRSSRPHIVGVDLSLDRMADNAALADKRVADVVTEGLPLASGEADIITSRSVLEHLSDVEQFINETARVLKRGGHSIHLLSGGFAPFALLNRLLPERLSQPLLFRLHPGSKDDGGQPAIYDRCYYRRLRGMFGKSGHEAIDIYANFGSNYFCFFVPLFLIESLYLITLQGLHLKSLAVSYLVTATRR